MRDVPGLHLDLIRSPVSARALGEVLTRELAALDG